MTFLFFFFFFRFLNCYHMGENHRLIERTSLFYRYFKASSDLERNPFAFGHSVDSLCLYQRVCALAIFMIFACGVSFRRTGTPTASPCHHHRNANVTKVPHIGLYGQSSESINLARWLLHERLRWLDCLAITWIYLRGFYWEFYWLQMNFLVNRKTIIVLICLARWFIKRATARWFSLFLSPIRKITTV